MLPHRQRLQHPGQLLRNVEENAWAPVCLLSVTCRQSASVQVLPARLAGAVTREKVSRQELVLQGDVWWALRV